MEGKEYEIVTFQGKHENEFCVYEVKDEEYNGRAQLFDDGILKMAWRMNNGIREGHVYMYDKGRLLKESQWNWLESEEEERWIENDKEKQVLVIRNCKSNQLMYVGEYNDKMEREGYGIEYTNGSLKLSGYWLNDELIHIHQRVLNKKEMIEYGGEKTEKNLNVLDRRPIYIGEFKFDKEKNRVLRHGFGCILDEYYGVCIKENKWSMGMEQEPNPMKLKNGRYKDGETDESMRMISSGHVNIANGKSRDLITHPSTEVINITSNSFIGSEITELKIVSFPHLKQLLIDDKCFAHMTRFLLDELNELEIVRVGRGDYSHCFFQYVQDNVFTISNCAKLKELTVGDYVFSECETVELNNLPSLRVLSVGSTSFQFACSFKLTSIPSLKEMVIGDNCFKNVTSFEMDGYNELECVKIGDNSFTLSLYSSQNNGYEKLVTRCGEFKLENCISLKQLQIGNGVFSWYSSIILSNVPSLKSIIIKNECYKLVSHFVIDGLIKLESITIGRACFSYSSNNSNYYTRGGEFALSNCPKVKRIELSPDSFNLYTSFELKNNPSLTTLQLGTDTFQYCQSVIFEGISD